MAFFILSFSQIAGAQTQYYRLEADFSIKEKNADGSFSLQMGRAYYDIKAKRVVYQLDFPRKETLITTDTASFRIRDEGETERHAMPGFVEQSIFHLILKGNLRSFGLHNSALTISEVERENGLVISSWVATNPDQKNGFKGKILVSEKNHRLFGVVSLDEKGDVLSKQFYENYSNVNGIEVPGKVIYITYFDGKENYRILELKSPQLNVAGKQNIYFHPIPVN